MAVSSLPATQRYWVTIFTDQGHEEPPIVNSHQIMAAGRGNALDIARTMVPTMNRVLIEIEAKSPIGRAIIYHEWFQHDTNLADDPADFWNPVCAECGEVLPHHHADCLRVS